MNVERGTKMAITVQTVEERRERAAQDLANLFSPMVIQNTLNKLGFCPSEIVEVYVDTLRSSKSEANKMKAAKELSGFIDETIGRFTETSVRKETISGSSTRVDRGAVLAEGSTNTPSPLPESLRAGIVDPIDTSTSRKETENARVGTPSEPVRGSRRDEEQAPEEETGEASEEAEAPGGGYSDVGGADVG